MNDPKSCPFCGSADIRDLGHYRMCYDCRATGPTQLRNWDDRAKPTDQEITSLYKAMIAGKRKTLGHGPGWPKGKPRKPKPTINEEGTNANSNS